MPKQVKLAPIDWIQAGFRALTDGGHQSIRVEPIARALKVSKGSFYWHFADLGAFKRAMLAHWMEQGTQSLLREAEATGSPQRKLQKLIELMTSDLSAPYGGLGAEGAIRDWARFDARAQATVATVSQTRLDYLHQLLKDLGQSATTAQRNAQLIYSAHIGLEFLAAQDLANASVSLKALVRKLVL